MSSLKDKKLIKTVSLKYISDPNPIGSKTGLGVGPKYYSVCDICQLSYITNKCYRCYRRRSSTSNI